MKKRNNINNKSVSIKNVLHNTQWFWPSSVGVGVHYLGITKKIFTFDLVIYIKNTICRIKILTEYFKAKDLNTIVALIVLNSSINIFNADINKDTMA